MVDSCMNTTEECYLKLVQQDNTYKKLQEIKEMENLNMQNNKENETITYT